MERWKPPRKQDLLPKIEPDANITKESLVVPDNKDDPEEESVRQAHRDAEIAVSLDRQKEAEIKTELREKGYQGIEDGLADILRMKEGAGKILLSAKSKESSVDNLLLELTERVESNKKKYLLALSALEKREDSINAKLEQAKKIEDGFKAKEYLLDIKKRDLQTLITYHQANILPCLNALNTISKDIDDCVEPLREIKGFTWYYFHIHRLITTVKSYINKMENSKNITS